MAIINPSTVGLGIRVHGKIGLPEQYGVYPWAGIWQVRRRDTGFLQVREKFYTPTDTWSQAKQDNRDKFADAVLAWQGLSSEEKEVYNNRAREYEMYGYNLFIRNYMYG